MICNTEQHKQKHIHSAQLKNNAVQLWRHMKSFITRPKRTHAIIIIISEKNCLHVRCEWSVCVSLVPMCLFNIKWHNQQAFMFSEMAVFVARSYNLQLNYWFWNATIENRTIVINIVCANMFQIRKLLSDTKCKGLFSAFATRTNGI